MLISIITICRNAEHEIGRTVASVAEQTAANFCEHLIIDGASTDATLAEARRLGKPDLKILSEPDKGLYDAMNKGLSMAQGDYVLFLNAGDKFQDTHTLALYAKEAGNGADIIYSDTVIVDDADRMLRPRHLSAPEQLTADSFKRGMLVCHQAFMVRRSLAPLYDLQYRFSADYDWCIECLRRSNPSKNVNLHTVGIRYLDAGLTDKNHRASLLERFHVMRCRYGTTTAIARHLAFIPRAIGRKFRKKEV